MSADVDSGHEGRGPAPRWSALNLCRLVERAGLDADKRAVVCDGESRTYAELRDRMVRAGRGLAALGVTPGDRVAVLARNCLEYLELELAIAHAGGIMVPLNYRLAEAEIATLLGRSRSRVVVVDAASSSVVAGLRPQLAALSAAVGLPEAPSEHVDIEYDDLCAGDAPPISVEPRMEDPHEITYTSGTTDTPKGVVWTHGSVMWNSIQQCMDYDISSRDSNYVLNDLYYVGGRHDFTWPLLHQGGTVHIRRSGNFDARAVMRYLSENAITKVLLFPVMLFELLRLPDLLDYDMTSLTTIMSGGEPVPVATIDRITTAFPGTDFIQVYGLTEGGASVTFLSGADARRKMGSCGKAGVHNEVRIASDDGTFVGPDVVGEVCVKGPTVTPGYWNDPERTAEAIVDGWLHTGDLGRTDEDGFLYIVGRKKDMIISGGMNIYPKEIEDVLGTHPAIAEVAVIGVPDPKWGERVCAVIRPEPGADIRDEDITALCAGRLASFKKPTVIHLVEAMPRTASGKVQKQVLRDRLATPASDTEVSAPC
ncbi:long-chain fatty acid--CoA ligase [Baekduia soli]|uniref:Long-chain fatty acid--CoA ligase n=1 Tax=Baekduia soli TaxID=496014 RepID=A0A5B8U089_9ACTN|nr:AMP-binding protein [Baekduia soli]QEC46386.1 long-chain fatty acid--CoA ligase [Baekduia soli]